MIVSLRGGEEFWDMVIAHAEHAKAGEYSAISGGDDPSEPEGLELRFLPADGAGSGFAVIALPTEISLGNPAFFDFGDRVEP